MCAMAFGYDEERATQWNEWCETEGYGHVSRQASRGALHGKPLSWAWMGACQWTRVIACARDRLSSLSFVPRTCLQYCCVGQKLDYPRSADDSRSPQHYRSTSTRTSKIYNPIANRERIKFNNAASFRINKIDPSPHIILRQSTC